MEEKKWSGQAWANAGPVYNKILQHPFITELMDGTLPEGKFRQYIAQDSLYLAEFGRVLAAIASKAGDIEHVLQFIRFAEGAVVVERALHGSFFQQLGIDKAGEKSPACFAYTHYLLSTVGNKNIEVAMAAVLPCFWIYKRVGDYILAHQNKTTANRYQNWIDTYSGEAFAESVQKAIEICDAVANQASTAARGQMTEAFLYSSKLEWMFWDSAYQLEKWAV